MKKKFLILTAVLSLFFLAGCGKKTEEPQDDPTPVEPEVPEEIFKVQMTKTQFIAGQKITSDLYSAEAWDFAAKEFKTLEQKDYSCNLLNKALNNQTEVVFTYVADEAHVVTLPITVISKADARTGVEFKFDETIVYQPDTDLTKLISYREAYNDGTFSAYTNIASDQVHVDIVEQKAQITVTVVLNGTEYKKEYEVAYEAFKEVKEVSFIDGRAEQQAFDAFDFELTEVSLEGVKIHVEYMDESNKDIPVTQDMLVDGNGWSVTKEGQFIVNVGITTSISGTVYNYDLPVKINATASTVSEANELAKATAIDFMEGTVVGVVGTQYGFDGNRVGYVYVSDGKKILSICYADGNNNKSATGYTTTTGYIVGKTPANEEITLKVGDKLVFSDLLVNNKTGTTNYIVPTETTRYVKVDEVDVKGTWFTPEEETIYATITNSDELAVLMHDTLAATSTGGTYTSRDFRKVIKLVGTQDNPLYIGAPQVSGYPSLALYYLEGQTEGTARSYKDSLERDYYFGQDMYHWVTNFGEEWCIANTPITEVTDPKTVTIETEAINAHAFVGEVYVVYNSRMKAASKSFNLGVLQAGCTLQPLVK